MSRWVRLCGDCWQSAHPDRYLPDRPLDYDTCAKCGADALVYGASNEAVQTDKKGGDVQREWHLR